MSNLNDNPWVQPHIDNEADFQDGNYALARRLVLMEYNGAPEPIPCPHECGHTTYWKSTIGAYTCPDCGVLAKGSGDPIGGPK
jgi:hypothetical protein